MRAWIVVTSVVLSNLVGCSKSEAPVAAPAAPVAEKAPAPAPAAPPGPSVEDGTFKLALVSEPSYAAGAASKLTLVLEARGAYHVNPDYPIKIELKAPGVTLPKPSLGKPDAAEFGEKIARFELPFTAAAGAHQLVADVDFAVCTPETCMPDQRQLAVSLAVK